MLQRAKNALYHLLPLRARFERINRRNQWGSAESVSGLGSTMANTANIRAALPGLFEELGVRRVVDVACGDFNWMREVVAETGVSYAGYDIVGAQVEANRARHGREGVAFAQADITSGMPDASGDLVLFRDCMLHLSFADGRAALGNLARADARWVLLSSFTDVETNRDIPSGRHRAIDVTRAPYDLPPPERTIQENEPNKILGLWPVEALRGRP